MPLPWHARCTHSPRAGDTRRGPRCPGLRAHTTQVSKECMDVHTHAHTHAHKENPSTCTPAHAHTYLQACGTYTHRHTCACTCAHTPPAQVSGTHTHICTHMETSTQMYAHRRNPSVQDTCMQSTQAPVTCTQKTQASGTGTRPCTRREPRQAPGTCTCRHTPLLPPHSPRVSAARMRQELDAAVGRSRAPGAEDRAHLPYVLAVLHELQRYLDLVPGACPTPPPSPSSCAGTTCPREARLPRRGPGPAGAAPVHHHPAAEPGAGARGAARRHRLARPAPRLPRVQPGLPAPRPAPAPAPLGPGPGAEPPCPAGTSRARELKRLCQTSGVLVSLLPARGEPPGVLGMAGQSPDSFPHGGHAGGGP
ncbi:translation initiation factor IF-2-like isoform X1 [Alligator sinensis]|uniref:Translation initiation factor IF-2-like isoform X1 n=1 Tax=Alligator sinensis TaxID=38654 RepID=A0A3Q0FPC6_ALLSI|nr:translation initiation factor IF-2-like isoform X1 [Alligator sinensis]